MDSITQKPLQYVRIPHCALCGQKLSASAAFRSLILSNDRCYHPIVTPSIFFSKNDDVVYVQSLGVQIHKYPRPDFRSAPSVHSICWTTASPNLPSIFNTYDLGVAMTPLVWDDLPQEIYQPFDISIKSVQSSIVSCSHGDTKTTLLELLERCAALPVELIVIIWSYVRPCYAKVLLALHASQSIWSAPSLATGRAVTSLFGLIRVYHTKVMHDTYICGVRQGRVLFGHESSHFIDISAPLLCDILVLTLGIYGLQRLEFLTGEGTGSTSLGVPPVGFKKFIGVILPRQEAPLRVHIEWDTLKITAIRYFGQPRFGHDFLWEPEVPWLKTGRLCSMCFYDWPRHFDFATQHQRVMAYIPLCRDSFVLYGLTAFCSSRGVIGLGTHFYSHSQLSKSYWFGRQHGCPVHIQLGYAETIKSVHVFWHQKDALSKPYLLISTDKRRVLTLGPCFPPSETKLKKIFNADYGDILGLYYDRSPGITGFTSVGAIFQPRELSPQQEYESITLRLQEHYDRLHRHHITRRLRASCFSTFSSQASFANVQSLKACYLESRCTGLLLQYNDGTKMVLGQWYESTLIQADKRDINFQHGDTLRFYFHEQNEDQVLTSIESLRGAGNLESNLFSIDIIHGAEIIWLFSNFSDIIFPLSDQ
ncbi:hypothetical protein BO71DRAFT_485219 [Aspergillus ellipticus CBS 707.79]|uniref:Uncharacterized protein n=1 Tax=Aspergillus ellipticus CBS 707.79 TaxID=1448320 RepID=A0A319DN83_9EURO|nr:hypothetical protein BO71DRAFT_485219 [Aspergillus ellipticus CBS 707.79]